MAVTEVSLLFTGRGGTDDFKRHRTYSRTYEVLTDDVNDDEQVVAAHEDLPILGDPFDADTDAVVVNVDAQQSDDSPYIWHLTYKYDTQPPLPEAVDMEGKTVSPAEMRAAAENPLLEPAKWNLTTEDSEEPAIRWRRVDPSGNIIVDLPPLRTTHTQYAVGAYVRNGANVYIQVAGSRYGGTTGAGAGPTGTGTLIVDAPASWAPSTPYSVGDVRWGLEVDEARVYRCITAGTSDGSGGPSGTGSEITDNTVVWEYYGTIAVWNFVDTVEKFTNDPNRALMKAIRNSAGLPFDPPLMVPVSRPVLRVTKNIAFASLAYLMTLKNAVNVVAWKGIPERCAKVSRIEHDGGHVKNGITYVATTWEISLDPETHDLRVLDAGLHQLITYYDETTTPPTQLTGLSAILGADDKPIAQPVPLNGGGKQLPTDAEPVYLRGVPEQMRIIDFNTAIPW